jgi:hypothetical protein
MSTYHRKLCSLRCCHRGRSRVGLAQYQKAFGVCMEGRGDAVK